jgi:hypothetical protein
MTLAGTEIETKTSNHEKINYVRKKQVGEQEFNGPAAQAKKADHSEDELYGQKKHGDQVAKEFAV